MKDVIFITWIGLTLFLSVGLSYINQNKNPDDDLSLIKHENPILPRIEAFESSYQVDLSAVKQMVAGDLFSPEAISLVQKKEKDFDVIVFGDSSVYMGFSPDVLKQKTQKKIGFFSFPALSMNKGLIDFIEHTAKKLLKKDGLLLFVFNHGFWSKDFYIEQENSELEKLILQRDLFTKFNICFFCAANQKAHFNNFDQLVLSLFDLPEKKLISFSLYDQYFAEYVTPTIHKKKIRNLNNRLKRGRYLYDNSFVFINLEKPNLIGKESKLNGLKPLKSKNLQLVYDTLLEKNIKFAFVIPLTTDPDMRVYLHRIYQSYFSEFPLADMNQLMPEDWIVEGQKLTHMSNLGSFQQALLLSTWLNRYYTGEEADSINQPMQDGRIGVD